MHNLRWKEKQVIPMYTHSMLRHGRLYKNPMG